MKLRSLGVLAIAISQPAFGGLTTRFIEPTPQKGPGVVEPTEEEKAAKIAEYQKSANEGFVGNGLSHVFGLERNEVSVPKVPGFISASPIAEVAKLVGPSNLTASYRIGDTVYFNWNSVPSPAIGQRFYFFTPAVVLQSISNPTDFSVVLRTDHMELSKDYRMAGYFYESNGTVRITRIQSGLVHGIIEDVRGQISNADSLMPIISSPRKVKMIESGIQIAAAVVAGSPVDRLSTTLKSFMYINRGARDGIKVGRVFHAIESVPMDKSLMGAAPEVSAGELVVVHVTDSYSVAMVTKQFDVVRVGSLLKTKQLDSFVPANAPFQGLFPTGKSNKPKADGSEIPEVPAIDEPINDDLPDPAVKKEKKPSLSDLDALEKSLKLDALTEQEKKKLDKLSRQEKIGVQDATAEASSDTPSDLNQPADDVTGAGDKKKKKKKASKKSSDEEELNQLMMQN